ncbi:MAG TPA: hypothetical protein PKD12_23600 [Nitrospira sp.]|nr:hypothetical protein [Nitrospira sp.]
MNKSFLLTREQMMRIQPGFRSRDGIWGRLSACRGPVGQSAP